MEFIGFGSEKIYRIEMETIGLFKKIRIEPVKKYYKNPILEKGDLGRWDDRGVRDQSLLTDPYGNLIKENGKEVSRDPDIPEGAPDWAVKRIVEKKKKLEKAKEEWENSEETGEDVWVCSCGWKNKKHYLDCEFCGEPRPDKEGA